MTSPNEKYVGEFKDGIRNGQGTLTFASGDKSAGVWESGNLVRAE